MNSLTTINEVKQAGATDTPVLFFECLLASGDYQRWSTHKLALDGADYAARVLHHNLFELQLSADESADGLSRVSLTLANADSALSQVDRAIGFKGGQLTVRFAFVDLTTATATTESTVLFRGICGDPDEVTESTLRLTFGNRLSLQRVPIPEVRIQRTCPWLFPATLAQRTEAAGLAAAGSYSRFYQCGYSPDVPNGAGNLVSGTVATSCDGSRASCQSRGMFTQDAQGRKTGRFGGFDFVPASTLVRTSGDKTSHMAAVVEGAAKYNDPAPLVYGTGWLKAPVIFASNDGNLTHAEALLSIGEITGVMKVVVNDVEIPKGVPGADMTATGWYEIVSSGTRDGSFDTGFVDASGAPLGDPYGSMAVLAVVVPNRIASGTSTPRVDVLLSGIKLDQYDGTGGVLAHSYTNNPAWIILDILRRAGWRLNELSLGSFSSSANYCSALVSSTDANGAKIYVPRYQCNLVLTKRQSAASLVRGIRVASSLLLRYGSEGLLELLPEASIADQQPNAVDGSNSTETLNGGWPTYEFSDATGPFSGIARLADGSPSLRLMSRNSAENSNRLSVEFQDEANEYQQDSFSVVDSDDSSLMGCEISSQSTALGIPNMSQAARVLVRQLRRAIDGNTFVEFATSFRALKVRPGDLITVTYLKEGLVRQPLRVLKLSPGPNYETVSILAQVHDDAWYTDEQTTGRNWGRSAASRIGVPRPVVGLLPHADSFGRIVSFDLQASDSVRTLGDGTAIDTISVGFSAPNKALAPSPYVPLVSLSALYQPSGGTLLGGSQFYYAVSSIDAAGAESGLSFTIPASIPVGSSSNAVVVNQLSFPNSAVSFNVYRGQVPQALYLIDGAVPVSNSYTDTGKGIQPVAPPDPSFDHVNLYSRAEFAGPLMIASATATSVTSPDMGATPSAFRGAIVRILAGKGSGQERSIVDNTATTLAISSAWAVVPDVTSTFVIAESGWSAAAVAKSSPVKFDVPYRAGSVLQVTARSANVNNVECSPDLSPMVRVPLGSGQSDVGTAGAPSFVLAATGAGELTLSQVGFLDTANTATVSSGTLQLLWASEVQPVTGPQLNAAVDAATSTLTITAPWNGVVGQTVLLGAELVIVLGMDAARTSLDVLRGALESTAQTHPDGEILKALSSSTVVVPFSRNFFLNRASMNFVHSIHMPNIRVCAAEFFVSNSFGDSQATQLCYTGQPGGGLRTLSGGQVALQVPGTLSNAQNACAPFLNESAHAVRDVRAIVSGAPSGCSVQVDVLQAGSTLCRMIVADGSTTSNVVDGATIPYLQDGEQLTANVTLIPTPGVQSISSTGRDMTVTIRL